MSPELPEDLTPVLRHLETTYPDEGCGVILRDPHGVLRIRPMVNAYGRFRELAPQAFPRTSRTAYLFDPKEWLTVLQGADASREQLTCIFHSHVDSGAYFSAEDRAMAAPEGEPLYPGVSYLVVAVDAGVATAARLFRWRAGDYEEARMASVRPLRVKSI